MICSFRALKFSRVTSRRFHKPKIRTQSNIILSSSMCPLVIQHCAIKSCTLICCLKNGDVPSQTAHSQGEVSKNLTEDPRSQGATRHHKVQLPFLVGNIPSSLPWQLPRCDDRLKLRESEAPCLMSSSHVMVKPYVQKCRYAGDEWKGGVIPIGRDDFSCPILLE